MCCKELILEKEVPSSEAIITLSNHFVALLRNEKPVSSLTWQDVNDNDEDDCQRIVPGFQLNCSNHIF